jgi:hypothetical protein
MTAQFAKILERFIGLAFRPTLSCEKSIGSNQFAYSKGRGARDALAYLVLSWLEAFRQKASIALYMSDVSGAFDRVSAQRLLDKLQSREVPHDLLRVLRSWLRKRSAGVIVGGVSSQQMSLENMVFQGTVWGPDLWNVFYADARHAIRKHSFEEIVFADDLNAWQKFEAGTSAGTMLTAMSGCQKEVHDWGDANQVTFDAAKEHMLILNRQRPHGGGFKLLGVDFDCKLVMSDAVYDLVTQCRWKLKAILRTRRFNSGEGLINLYKAQILSFIEYRTAAIYHACSTALAELDSVQSKVLEAAGVTEVEALLSLRLAPLAARRDMALLGLMHRTMLGKGPPHFKRFFKLDEQACQNQMGRHRLQVKELEAHWSDFALPGSRPAAYIEHSMFGLVRVYNSLPAEIVEASLHVSAFQAGLQDVLRSRASAGISGWQYSFSPRSTRCFL